MKQKGVFTTRISFCPLCGRNVKIEKSFLLEEYDSGVSCSCPCGFRYAYVPEEILMEKLEYEVDDFLKE